MALLWFHDVWKPDEVPANRQMGIWFCPQNVSSDRYYNKNHVPNKEPPSTFTCLSDSWPFLPFILPLPNYCFSWSEILSIPKTTWGLWHNVPNQMRILISLTLKSSREDSLLAVSCYVRMCWNIHEYLFWCRNGEMWNYKRMISVKKNTVCKHKGEDTASLPWNGEYIFSLEN